MEAQGLDKGRKARSRPAPIQIPRPVHGYNVSIMKYDVSRASINTNCQLVCLFSVADDIVTRTELILNIRFVDPPKTTCAAALTDPSTAKKIENARRPTTQIGRCKTSSMYVSGMLVGVRLGVYIDTCIQYTMAKAAAVAEKDALAAMVAEKDAAATQRVAEAKKEAAATSAMAMEECRAATETAAAAAAEKALAAAQRVVHGGEEGCGGDDGGGGGEDYSAYRRKARHATEELAHLARQATAALETCRGDDVDQHRKGLLCMQQCHAQTLAQMKNRGMKKLEGINSSLVVGPTLALIFRWQWILEQGSDSLEHLFSLITSVSRDCASMIEGLEASDFRYPKSMSDTIGPSLRPWLDAEIRALRRVQCAVHQDRGGPESTIRQFADEMVRRAKLAAWPLNETLDVDEQPRLLAVASDEVFAYKTERDGVVVPCSYGVGAPRTLASVRAYKACFQFEDDRGNLLGTRWHFTPGMQITNDDLRRCLHKSPQPRFIKHRVNFCGVFAPVVVAHTFYVGDRDAVEVLSDMGKVASEGQLSEDEASEDEAPSGGTMEDEALEEEAPSGGAMED
jgi:hypothetical protein